ncbi:MAG: pyridoxamine 5'-phosphate oxidase family protein [Ilumatobacteraceae bacterium]
MTSPPSAAATIRVETRAHYDRETIDSLLDEGLVAHVGLVAEDGRPVVVPMFYARRGDELLLHGSPATRLLRSMKRGVPICVTVTHVDGLVLARSAFHHSMNFRSVVVFGVPRLLTGDEAVDALDSFMTHLIPGRLEQLRPMTRAEILGTSVVAVPIDEASAKIRAGGPIDDDEDLDEAVWAGVLPLSLTPGPPIPAADLRSTPVPPDHVESWTVHRNAPTT